jgi:hypothetical protein
LAYKDAAIQKVPLPTLLQLLCKQINSTYVIIDNLIVIGPQPSVWKAEFHRSYGLKQGEVLRRLAAPFPASRADYCKFLKAGFFPNMDFANVTMSYRWDGKNVEFWSLTPESGGVPLVTLLECMGVPSQ